MVHVADVDGGGGGFQATWKPPWLCVCMPFGSTIALRITLTQKQRNAIWINFHYMFFLAQYFECASYVYQIDESTMTSGAFLQSDWRTEGGSGRMPIIILFCIRVPRSTSTLQLHQPAQ